METDRISGESDEVVLLELSDEEKKELEAASNNLDNAEKIVNQNESAIAKIENILLQRDLQRNAYAATYFRILSKHKVDETECSPSPDRKGIIFSINSKSKEATESE